MSIKNIEIKCLVSELGRYRNILEELGANKKGVDLQVDTYFNVPSGRLKLREGNVENSLIYYNRVETDGLKESDIELERFKEKTNLKNILKKSLGIKIEVSKKREIYFLKNVKIHLDEVEGLGFFVEIEAIDTDEKFSVDELHLQCNKLIKKFNLNEDKFIPFSYSDFFKAKTNPFFLELETQARSFYQEIIKKLGSFLDDNYMDHLCYRVETQAEYNNIKSKLDEIGLCLVESEIGGRLISTYKLDVPLIINDRILYLIELPMPKKDNAYKAGFEHAEFVIDESFEDFSKKMSFDFDWKGTEKSHNPELRLRLGNHSVKFHHKSLEEVIQDERS